MGEERVTFLLLPQVAWPPVVEEQNLFVPSSLFFFYYFIIYTRQLGTRVFPVWLFSCMTPINVNDSCTAKAVHILLKINPWGYHFTKTSLSPLQPLPQSSLHGEKIGSPCTKGASSSLREWKFAPREHYRGTGTMRGAHLSLDLTVLSQDRQCLLRCCRSLCHKGIKTGWSEKNVLILVFNLVSKTKFA